MIQSLSRHSGAASAVPLKSPVPTTVKSLSTLRCLLRHVDRAKRETAVAKGASGINDRSCYRIAGMDLEQLTTRLSCTNHDKPCMPLRMSVWPVAIQMRAHERNQDHRRSRTCSTRQGGCVDAGIDDHRRSCQRQSPSARSSVWQQPPARPQWQDDPRKAGLLASGQSRLSGPNERRHVISNERDMPRRLAIDDSRAALKALGDNPQLLLIRPAPPAVVSTTSSRSS